MMRFRIKALGNGAHLTVSAVSATPTVQGAGRYVWEGIDQVLLHAGNRTLRLDTSPDKNLPWPSDTGTRTRLSVNQNFVSKDGDDWVLSNGKEMELMAHCQNPLTPCSAGIWLRLRLLADAGRLLILCDQQSAVIYAERMEPISLDSDTTSLWLDAFLPKRAEFAALMDARIVYAKDGRWPKRCGALLSEQPMVGSLINVDLNSNASGDRFFLAPAPSEPGEWPLCFGFELPQRTLGRARSEALGESSASEFAHIEAADVSMRCARAISADAQAWEWLLDWEVPVSGPSSRLSFERLWRWRSLHYRQGLTAIRARNQLSYVPSTIAAAGGKATLRFQVVGSTRAALKRTRLRQVWLDGPDFIVEFGNARNVDETSPRISQMRARSLFTSGSVAAPFLLAQACRQPLPSEWLALELTPSPGSMQPAADQAIGAVRLRASAADRVVLRVREDDGVGRFGSPSLSVRLGIALSGAQIGAASQDPEFGFETLSAWLRRERPMAIDLSDGATDLRVLINETANSAQSRLLRIQLTTPTEIDSLRQDVLVLDTAPLTFARVVSETGALAAGAIVAEYTDDSEQPAEWVYVSETGAMHVILPPQSIGEEMIKGRIYLRDGGLTECPVPGKLFDFRLSSNTVLELDRTDIDSARSIAPWGLRRLLARRLGSTGAKLQSARVELLYGMVATLANDPNDRRRIAELEALIGSAPLADAWIDRLREFQLAQHAKLGNPPQVDDTQARLRAHVNRLATWIADLLKRSSDWPVFADATDDARGGTQDAASFRLRASRDTADPFEPHLAYGGKSPGSRRPLRGGVDWPFQSKPVYRELLDDRKPGTGSIKNLRFGALGGSGAQLAMFNQGKTQIISSTTQGRLDSLTVIRVGRIAMLWNHARHVIVYERTVRRAPRYAGSAPAADQDTWEWQDPRYEGFAALRKVREYIEITQPVRDYPERTTDRPYSGALQRSRFQTTIIPVRSNWGTDLDQGFEMPLRGPIPPGEEAFFPSPQIFLEFARAADKGGGRVAQQLADPAQLRFFSSTRDGDSGDTDTWPAFLEIDYPAVERPQAPHLPYRSSFAGWQQQPDAVRADFGQSRYSVDLLPAEEAVNLMHGRDVAGIDVRLRALSLARGKPRSALPTAVASVGASRVFAHADGVVRDAVFELRHALTAKLQQIGDAPIGALGEFRDDALALAERLRQHASDGAAAGRAAAASAFDWALHQEALIDAARDQATRAIGDFQQQLRVDAGIAIDEFKRQARSALESVHTQAESRLGSVRLMADEGLHRVKSALANIDQRIQAYLSREVGVVLSELARMGLELQADPSRVFDLEAQFRQQCAAAADGLMRLASQAEDWVREQLGPSFSQLGDAPVYKRLCNELRQLLALARAQIVDELDDQLPWSVQAPDFAELEADIRRLMAPVALTDVASLGEWLSALAEPVTSAWNEHLAKARVNLKTVVETFAKDIDQLADPAAYQAQLARFSADLKSTFDNLQSEANTLAKSILNTDIWKQAIGNFNAAEGLPRVVQDRLGKVIDVLKDPASSLEALATAAESQLRDLTDHWQVAGEQLVRQLASDMRARLPEIPGAESVLEMARALATGPVAEALACSREAVGYYLDALKETVDLTRSSAYFNNLGNDVLNALSAEMPFDRLRDRLLPQLGNLDISKLFPDFGGLKLEHLLPDLRIPDDPFAEYEWLKIKHGFDKDRMTAWADVAIDRRFESDATLLNLGPITIELLQPQFVANSQLRVGEGGNPVQKSSAELSADWVIALNRKPLVTFREATLKLDSEGDFAFNFDSENLELAEELDFISQALAVLMPSDEGLMLTPLLPAGISAELCMPLPDLGAGAFTLTGITLFAHFDLLVDRGFELRTGLWLSKPERPFGLAVLFLGGGGWFGVEIGYRPPSKFTTRLSIGISAGAFLALNLGFARASAGLLFTAGVEFYRDSSTNRGSTAISVGLLIWGEFSLMGIASAYLRLVLRITYQDGGMTGYGSVSIRIKISIFFTFRLNRSFTRVFAAPKKTSSSKRAIPAATMSGTKLASAGVPTHPNYETAKPPAVQAKVNAWLQTLDLS